MFIDKVNIHCKAGDGGAGCISFHREKYVAKGGPDGGDGGRGGNIVFVIDKGTNTLLAFRYRKKYIAENGENGKPGKMHGKSADDLLIYVPEGTLIRDAETGRIIHDMSDEKPYILCRGGRGGWGNRHFATPTRQIPRFAKNGMKGGECDVTLELKMIADVGLVGLPSVGKSSILASISAAKPKIAEYHFTTLSPNLGVVGFGDGGYVVADIPGLIEGAADGAGLGHEFLRHIERCRMIVHVVDVASTEGRDPISDIETVCAELEKYSPALAELPVLVAGNKIDAVDENTFDRGRFEDYVHGRGWELIYISAATGENMKEFTELVGDRLKTLPPVVVYEPEMENMPKISSGTETKVRREGDKFVVEGEWLFNLLGQVNLSDRESLSYFGRVLTKYGVIDLLEEKGCRNGDTVSIYDFEFDFIK